MSVENIQVEKLALNFAKNIIKLVISITQKDIKLVVGKQLMRAGTSIGANIEEAQGGFSKRDFTHSMNIAKKEAREALYWLRLLEEFDSVNIIQVKQLINDCTELVKILTSIVKTSQQNKS
jgi:four helix bundle protein